MAERYPRSKEESYFPIANPKGRQRQSARLNPALMAPGSLTRGVGHALQAVLKIMGLNEHQVSQAIKRRPLLSLFLSFFLLCGALPLLTFLFFVGGTVCVGVFLLVVTEVGFIVMATITLLVTLTFPACFAGGVSGLVYLTYLALVRMRGAMESAVSLPHKLWRAAAMKEAGEQASQRIRKRYQRHRRGPGLKHLLKIITDDPGSDPDDSGFEGTESQRALRGALKSPFTRAPKLALSGDRVGA